MHSLSPHQSANAGVIAQPAQRWTIPRAPPPETRGVRRIQRAREHDVLPSHQSHLVARSKRLVLDWPPPHSRHVHFRVARRAAGHGSAQGLTLRQAFAGDPFAPLQKRSAPFTRNVILMPDVQTCRRIMLVYHLDCPHPNLRVKVSAPTHTVRSRYAVRPRRRPPHFGPLDHHRRPRRFMPGFSHRRATRASPSATVRALSAASATPPLPRPSLLKPGTMGLFAIDIIDARQIAAQQLHGTREPGSHQRDAPVPSSRAGGLRIM
jgi:hypothetical protein